MKLLIQQISTILTRYLQSYSYIHSKLIQRLLRILLQKHSHLKQKVKTSFIRTYFQKKKLRHSLRLIVWSKIMLSLDLSKDQLQNLNASLPENQQSSLETRATGLRPLISLVMKESDNGLSSTLNGPHSLRYSQMESLLVVLIQYVS